MSAELPKPERARIMSELDEFFPEVKHSEREMHLLDENQQLESRIAALSVALTEADDIRARLEAELVEAYRLLELEKAKDGDTWKERAVTERAAREKAEKEAAQYKLWFTETAKSHEATNAHLERAEHERDTALARMKELDAALASARADLNIALSAAADMRTAADQRAGVRGRVKVHVETRLLPALSRLYDTLTSHPAPVAAHCQECAELGACPAEAERLFEESGDDEPEEDTVSLIEQLNEALCSLLHTGGEIGEHSPRTHLDLFYAKQAESPVAVLPPISESDEAIVGALIDARTPPSKPMPAPVAAPKRSTRDVVETAIDLTKDDKHSRWNALMARTAELPVTVMATSKYPSPAPCSGCAALSAAIDQAIRDMLSGGHPFEVGVAKAINDLRAAQKEHGNG